MLLNFVRSQLCGTFCHIGAAAECSVKVKFSSFHCTGARLEEKQNEITVAKNTQWGNRMKLAQVILNTQGAHESIPLQNKEQKIHFDPLVFISSLKFYTVI